MRRILGELGYWIGWTLNQVLVLPAFIIVGAMNFVGRAGLASRRWGRRG